MQKIIGHREQMDFSALIKLWFYVDDEILSCIEKNLDYMDTTINFLREQVENQWSTLGQIYVDYTTEVSIYDVQLSNLLTSIIVRGCRT
jgi:hypothetical protein